MLTSAINSIKNAFSPAVPHNLQGQITGHTVRPSRALGNRLLPGKTILKITPENGGNRSIASVEQGMHPFFASSVNSGNPQAIGKLAFKLPKTPDALYQGALSFINSPKSGLLNIKSNGRATLNKDYIEPYQVLQTIKTFGFNPAMLQEHVQSDTSGFLSKLQYLARLDTSGNENLKTLLSTQAPAMAPSVQKEAAQTQGGSSIYQQFMSLVAQGDTKTIRNTHVTSTDRPAAENDTYCGALGFLNPSNAGGLIRQKDGYAKFAKGEKMAGWMKAAQSLHAIKTFGCDPSQVIQHYEDDTSGGLQKLQILAGMELQNNPSLSEAARACLAQIMPQPKEGGFYPTLPLRPAEPSAPPAYAPAPAAAKE